jgi:hypothetical protein
MDSVEFQKLGRIPDIVVFLKPMNCRYIENIAQKRIFKNTG